MTIIILFRASDGVDIKCEFRENENFQLEINACNIFELFTLERGEHLNINVGNNSLQNITSINFEPPGQLQLNLTFMPSELFVILPKLNKLELRAKIETITVVDFLNARNLEELTLNNQLTKLTTHVFSLARNLTSLLLSRNRISIIEDNAFDGLNKLEKLALAKNQLTRLNRLMFTGLSKLSFLNLRDNDISIIEDGTFELPNLEEIAMSKNKLKRLSDTLFQGTPLLRVINIDNNELEHIGDSMYGLKNLARIILYQNKIDDFDVIALSKLPELAVLWLRDSGFTFGNRSLNQFQASNSKVTYIDISANHLNESNDIQRLSIFKQLKTLILDGNEYTELNLMNRTLREYFPDIETIHLSQNKWNCDWLKPVIQQLIADHVRPVSTDCA